MNKRIWILILAFFLAAFIWFEINLTKTQKVDVEFPITISNAPRALVLIQMEPEAIDITVEGKGQDILAFNTKKYAYHVDLKDVHYGKNYLPIHWEELDGIKEHDLTIIQQPAIDDILVVMDNMNTLTVPVRLEFVDDSSKVYFIENELDITPEEVVLTGPQTYLSKIEEVASIPFDKDIHVEDPHLSLIQPEESMVAYDTYTVDITIKEPTILQKTISLIPINTPDGITVFPPSVSVKVSGEEELITILEEKDISASAVIPDSFMVDDEVAVDVEVPDGVELLGQTPEVVRIKVITQ